jgi:phosphoglycolate phosphatase-like HAD superfamily hydrolase
VNQELRQVANGVFATSRTVMQVEVADAVVFDVDGVLIDVHHSYPYVICMAAEAYLKECGFRGQKAPATPDETTFFKAAGGFNSDWNLAQGIVLCYLVKALATGSRDLDGLAETAPDIETIARASGEYGGGLDGLRQALQTIVEVRDWQQVEAEWDRARITRLCQEFYAGSEATTVFGIPAPLKPGPGRMAHEKPMMTRAVLEQTGLSYGVYTGRNYGETLKALELAHLEGVFAREAMITETEGLKKPNPEGLFRVAAALKPRLMIFCGDNLDDWQTASRYEAERGLDQPPCLFCGVLGGSPGALSYGLFYDRGATLMAKSAEALLAWVRERQTMMATH